MFSYGLRSRRLYPNAGHYIGNFTWFVDITDIDQHLRTRQAVIHRRNKALPTGQDLCVISMLTQQFTRMIKTRGPKILKISWFHIG